MELPNGGRIAIVDDCVNEIMPLISILNKQNISVVYYEGTKESLPSSPQTGIRLVFLDLRFGPVIDPKTIVANAVKVLEKIISPKNGPYALVTWSSTGEKHTVALRNRLKKSNIAPEIIVSISKDEFFETVETVDIAKIEDALKASDLDSAEISRVKDDIIGIIYPEGISTHKRFRPEMYDDLSKVILKSIKNAGLLELFVKWENEIGNAISDVTSGIFGFLPDGDTSNDKMQIVIDYLARNSLEQLYEDADDKDCLSAAVRELNSMYPFFYENNTQGIDKEIKAKFKKCKKNPYMSSNASSINSWKMIRTSSGKNMPGQLYIDKEKRFSWRYLIDEKKLKKENPDNIQYEKNYKIIEKDLVRNKEIIYILLNINGECETAQKKAPFMKLVPGVLIPAEVYKTQNKANKLIDINNTKESFSKFAPIHYKEKDYIILFNLNQPLYIEFSEAVNYKILFELNRRYLMAVRQAIANNYAKQGVDIYQ